MSSTRELLKPRKSPVQARSTATVDSLHAAAIHVLIHEGLNRCTTTRVAERAGASVGSLYQYFPNRDALLAAVLERHLDDVATVVETACQSQHGAPARLMVQTLVRAYLSAKLRDVEESKALYAVAHERGGRRLAVLMRKRIVDAIADMIGTAPDVEVDDPLVIANFVLGAMFGPIHTLLEGLAPMRLAPRFETELVTLLTAYLTAR